MVIFHFWKLFHMWRYDVYEQKLTWYSIGVYQIKTFIQQPQIAKKINRRFHVVINDNAFTYQTKISVWQSSI